MFYCPPGPCFILPWDAGQMLESLVITIHQAEHPGLAVAGWNAAGIATLPWLIDGERLD